MLYFLMLRYRTFVNALTNSNWFAAAMHHCISSNHGFLILGAVFSACSPCASTGRNVKLFKSFQKQWISVSKTNFEPVSKTNFGGAVWKFNLYFIMIGTIFFNLLRTNFQKSSIVMTSKNI